jgi:hypothetical protein
MWERLSAALLRALAHSRCDDAALHEMMLARTSGMKSANPCWKHTAGQSAANTPMKTGPGCASSILQTVGTDR